MNRKDQESTAQPGSNENSNEQQRSSAFNEQSTQDIKSTVNPEEEASLEQERKDAMTERD